MMSLLSVSGDVDISNSPALDGAIAAASQAYRGLVVISFADCQFADGSCVRVLIRQFKLLPARLLIVAAPGSWLRRLLDLTSLTATLPVYNGLREAHLPMVPGARSSRDALATCNS
jgi:anti-anti-sigma factor